MPQANIAEKPTAIPPTFDTYQIIQSLTKVGADEALALAVVNAIKAGISGGLATHEDIFSVKTQISDVETKLTTEIHEVDTKLTAQIHELDEKLTAQINNVETKIHGVETKLTAKIHDVETKLTAEINDVKVEISGVKTSLDNLVQKLMFRISGLIVVIATIFKAIDLLF